MPVRALAVVPSDARPSPTSGGTVLVVGMPDEQQPVGDLHLATVVVNVQDMDRARALVEARPDARVVAVGTAAGMETRLVPAAGFRLETIERVPMPRSLSVDLFKLPVRLVRAVRQALRIIDGAAADVVVGVGGVFTADDAWEKLAAGASLVQVYTGLVYGGPGTARAMISRSAGLTCRSLPPLMASTPEGLTSMECSRLALPASAQSPGNETLADIRQQVEEGAAHILFGDPDFFNGIRHAREVMELVRSRDLGVALRMARAGPYSLQSLSG